MALWPPPGYAYGQDACTKLSAPTTISYGISLPSLAL